MAILLIFSSSPKGSSGNRKGGEDEKHDKHEHRSFLRKRTPSGLSPASSINEKKGSRNVTPVTSAPSTPPRLNGDDSCLNKIVQPVDASLSREGTTRIGNFRQDTAQGEISSASMPTTLNDAISGITLDKTNSEGATLRTIPSDAFGATNPNPLATANIGNERSPESPNGSSPNEGGRISSPRDGRSSPAISSHGISSPSSRLQNANLYSAHPSPVVSHGTSSPIPRSGSPGIPRSGSPGIPRSGSPGIPRSGSPGIPRSGSPGIPRSDSPAISVRSNEFQNAATHVASGSYATTPPVGNPGSSSIPRSSHSGTPTLPHDAEILSLPRGMKIVTDLYDHDSQNSTDFHSANTLQTSLSNLDSPNIDAAAPSMATSDSSATIHSNSSTKKKDSKKHGLSLKRFFDKVKHHHHSHHSLAKLNPVTSPHHEPNLLFQKYGSIGKHLGTGASGSVNLVRSNTDPNKIFAVKKFLTKLPGETDNDFKIRVRNEFQIGEVMKHENLIHTYELIKDYSNNSHSHKHIKIIQEPEYFMVMEYCPFDFFNLVMSGLMSNEEILCYFKQIVSGVAFMHEQGIAHRDLKLDNCVVNDQGILKIIDYGSVIQFRREILIGVPLNPEIDEILDEGKFKLVRARGVVGLDPYLAPEVLEPSNFGYDPRYADVWSIAIIFCCMILKRFPWKLPKLSDPSYRSFVGVPDERSERPVETQLSGAKSPTPRGPARLLRHLPHQSRDLIGHMLKIEPKGRILTKAITDDEFFKGIDVCSKGEVMHKHNLISEEELGELNVEKEKN